MLTLKPPAAAPGATAWDAGLAKLASLRTLKDDWDDNGALAPRPPLIDAAEVLLARLRDRGWPAPFALVPSVEGTVVCEWRDDRELIEFEVADSTIAQGFRFDRATERVTRLSDATVD